jgi:hypothetical protein
MCAQQLLRRPSRTPSQSIDEHARIAGRLAIERCEKFAAKRRFQVGNACGPPHRPRGLRSVEPTQVVLQ